MRGSTQNEELINDLGGRRHLKNMGVNAIHCNDDGSIDIIFQGYSRITISKVRDNNYNIIRPSTTYEKGIGVFNNITLFEVYDIITVECNICLWSENNKSKGQLFSELIIEHLGGWNYLKKTFDIKNVKYLTSIEKLEFNLNNNLNVPIYFEIIKSKKDNVTVIKKMNKGGIDTVESIKDISPSDLLLNFKFLIADEYIIRSVRYNFNPYL